MYINPNLNILLARKLLFTPKSYHYKIIVLFSILCHIDNNSHLLLAALPVQRAMPRTQIPPAAPWLLILDLERPSHHSHAALTLHEGHVSLVAEAKRTRGCDFSASQKWKNCKLSANTELGSLCTSTHQVLRTIGGALSCKMLPHGVRHRELVSD